MSTDPIDYEAVLADLRAKREKLDAAITGIETMLGIRGLGANEAQNGNKPATEQLGPGAFLGMTIVDATMKYLRITRQNQKTEDILRALRDGGVALQSSNPINTVGSVLARNAETKGDIVRVERGLWGLGEWHKHLRKKAGGRLASASNLNELVDAAVEDVADDLGIDPLDTTPSTPNEP